MISEGEIKEGTKFREGEEGRYYIVKEHKLFEKDGNLIKNKLDNLQIAFGTFELIEEQQDIDIQAIEELYEWVTRRNGEVTQTEGKILEIGNKLNKLIQAIKQLDRNIRKEK